jgi:predicted RNase H-like HicB family nuclease
MKHIIQFHVSKGEKYYTAQCTDAPIVTQAESLDTLAGNIKEALALHMEDGDLGDEFDASPSILVSFELPPLRAYA